MVLPLILLIIIIFAFLVYLKCYHPLYLRVFVLNLLSTLLLIWLPLLLIFYHFNTPLRNLFFRKEEGLFNNLNLIKELKPLKTKLLESYSQILDELSSQL